MKRSIYGMGTVGTVFLTMHGFIAFMPIWNEMHG